MPKVSIQISVYNGEDHIEEAVLSALNSGCEDFEVLIRDDGSVDSTLDIIKRLAVDKRVRFLHGTERVGTAVSRNQLLNETDAEFILILDGDDILVKGWPEKAMAYLNDSDFDGVYGKMRLVNERLEDLGQIQGGRFSRFNYCYSNPVCHGGMLIKKSALIASGAYMETSLGRDSVGLDGFLWYRVGLNHRILFVNELSYLYRRHSTQMTNKLDKYDVCNDYMKNYMLNIDKALTVALLNGQDIDVAPEQVNLALFLLGILSQKAPVGSAGHLAFIRKAEAIDSSDYGVLLRKVQHEMALRKYPKARREARKVVDRFSDDFYCQMMGCKFISEISNFIGDEDKFEVYKEKYEESLAYYIA